MKKARQIVVPEDRPLTYKEYENYSEHAFNSSLWYAGEFLRNEQQVREKLYRKGYPADEVPVVDPEGKIFQVNMVEDALARLVEAEVVSDRAYAEAFYRRKLSGGTGLSKAKFELQVKGISKELAEDVALDFEDSEEVDEGFERLFMRTVEASSFRALDPRKQQQKLFSTLARKGYSMDKIGERLRQWKEEGEDLA